MFDLDAANCKRKEQMSIIQTAGNSPLLWWYNLLQKENQTGFVGGSHFRALQLNALSPQATVFLLIHFIDLVWLWERIFSFFTLILYGITTASRKHLERFCRCVRSRVTRFEYQPSRNILLCSVKSEALNCSHCPNVGMGAGARIPGVPETFSHHSCLRVGVGMKVSNQLETMMGMFWSGYTSKVSSQVSLGFKLGALTFGLKLSKVGKDWWVLNSSVACQGIGSLLWVSVFYF